MEECSTWEMQRLTILYLFGPQHVEAFYVCGSYGWDKQAAVGEVPVFHRALQSQPLPKINFCCRQRVRAHRHTHVHAHTLSCVRGSMTNNNGFS
jgi:hypothetical protein